MTFVDQAAGCPLRFSGWVSTACRLPAGWAVRMQVVEAPPQPRTARRHIARSRQTSLRAGGRFAIGGDRRAVPKPVERGSRVDLPGRTGRRGPATRIPSTDIWRVPDE